MTDTESDITDHRNTKNHDGRKAKRNLRPKRGRRSAPAKEVCQKSVSNKSYQASKIVNPAPSGKKSSEHLARPYWLPNSENTSKLLCVQQREIDEMEHSFGSKRIRLFKKGKNVKSFGLVIPNILDQKSITFIVHIPHNYPQNPIKIEAKPLSKADIDKSLLSSPQQRCLLRIVNNFNMKARELNSKSEPLAMQLNYLMNEWPSLGAFNFKQNDELHKFFLSQFLE